MTTKQTWKPFPDECDICGCGVDVLTDASGDGECYDGDEVSCPACGQTGCIHADEAWDDDEPEAWIDWDWEEQPEANQ